jgi:hypothetical protein
MQQMTERFVEGLVQEGLGTLGSGGFFREAVQSLGGKGMEGMANRRGSAAERASNRQRRIAVGTGEEDWAAS